MIDMEIYYDRGGMPITMEEWGRLFADQTYKRVARTKVTDAADPSRAVDVSTVWMGMDHSFTSDGPPIIFETMTFPEGPLDEQYCARYAAGTQAREGHTAAVIEASIGMADPIVIDVEEQP